MVNACSAVPVAEGFASGTLTFLDCQARTLGVAGYQVLAAPGSSASIVLAAMLTIFVAIIGYRLLFGDAPTARDGVLSILKIGIVLALATSWPAYQVLVYDIVMNAPTELAVEVGSAAGLVDAGGIAGRLDVSDQAFRSLAIYGVGQPVANVDGQWALREPGLFIGFDTFALGASRAIFLASALGAFALVRLVSGLLLALGPLFIAFLLFDGTRGLFEGWARGLVALALGALTTSILLAVELALLEPWLSDLLARRGSGVDISGVPVQLLAIVAVFAVTLVAAIGAVGKVGWSLQLPPALRVNVQADRSSDSERMRELRISSGRGNILPGERSRATATADAIATLQRREEGRIDIGRATVIGGSVAPGARGGAVTEPIEMFSRLADASARARRPRRSAGAARRDIA